VFIIGHIDMESNPADLATKIIPGSMKCYLLVDMVLYDMHETHINNA
jgi:hypothetical protein